MKGYFTILMNFMILQNYSRNIQVEVDIKNSNKTGK